VVVGMFVLSSGPDKSIFNISSELSNWWDNLHIMVISESPSSYLGIIMQEKPQ